MFGENTLKKRVSPGEGSVQRVPRAGVALWHGRAQPRPPPGDGATLGLGTSCPPHRPAMAALVQFCCSFSCCCSVQHRPLVGLWSQHGLSWGGPELLPRGVARELLFVPPTRSLTYISRTMWVSQWSSPTISTLLPGELETPPQGDGISAAALGNPRCPVSPVPRCRSVGRAGSTHLPLHLSRQSSKG